jgi:hypothetical protein
MPDDHSVVEPPLPIPNRTVKRLSADDSEPALVKIPVVHAHDDTSLDTRFESMRVFAAHELLAMAQGTYVA